MTTDANSSQSPGSQHQDDDYSGLDSTFQIITLDSSHPLYLHSSDHPGQVLVTTTLICDNFNEWTLSMTFALSAKKKLGFVTGKFKVPGIKSPYFDHWQRCNDMIITWIFNSLSPYIRSSLVYASLVENIWNDLLTHFTQSNGPRIFELKCAISDLRQDTQIVSAYYTRFKQLTDDRNNMTQVLKCICVCACTVKTQIEQYEHIMKVTQFLMGLNDSYTNIRGQLLMMTNVPKITQILALLQQEERQRSYTSSSTVESIDLATHQLGSNTGFGNKPRKAIWNVLTVIVQIIQKRDAIILLVSHQGTGHLVTNTKSQLSRNGSNTAKIVAHVQTIEDSTDSSQTHQTSISNTLSNSQYQQLIAMLNQAFTGTSTLEPLQSGHITCNKTVVTGITTCSVNICLPNGQFA